MNDTPNMGQSFNADELYKAQLLKLRERMVNEQPDLLAKGRQVMLAHLRADRDLEALKRELFTHFGGEGRKDGLAMLTSEASTMLKAEEHQAALDAERRAVEAAQAKKAVGDVASAHAAHIATAQPAKQSAPQQSSARR